MKVALSRSIQQGNELLISTPPITASIPSSSLYEEALFPPHPCGVVTADRGCLALSNQRNIFISMLDMGRKGNPFILRCADPALDNSGGLLRDVAKT